MDPPYWARLVWYNQRMARRILIVDDDTELSGFLVDGLKISGFETLSAENGEEGVRIARLEKPDLMIVDLAMPRMNGYEVCRAVRGDPSIAKTPIIITSGKNYAVDVKMAQTAGANMYFVKPYSLKDIALWIGRLLGDLPPAPPTGRTP